MIDIRPYRPSDRADVADVCVRTANSGAGAAGLYSSDALLPDVYALPYVDREPELAFVADNGERVVGYVLGTADTRAFAAWFSETWWPAVSATYAAPVSGAEERLRAAAADGERMLLSEVDVFPAHLHVDLLPEAQGQGLGRRLIDVLCLALAGRGIPGLHLTMGADNVHAGAFYDRLGFRRLGSSTASATSYGMRLIEADAVAHGKRIGRRSNQ